MIELDIDGSDVEPLMAEKEEVEIEISWFSDKDEGPMWIESIKVGGSEGEYSDSKRGRGRRQDVIIFYQRGEIRVDLTTRREIS